MKLKILIFVLLMEIFAGIFLQACASCGYFEKKSAPYELKAQMVIDPSAIYEGAGLEYSFYNKSDKTVKALTFVFFLNSDEEVSFEVFENLIELEVCAFVEPQSFVEDCVSLDSFLYEVPEEPYQLDYLYVSRIVYEDGSEWTDPFGVCAF